MQAHTCLNKCISLATAQRWMKKLDIWWTNNPKGQFVDGYKWEDIVAYHQNIFLPAWAKLKSWTWDWPQGLRQPDPLPHEHHIVVWFHKESIFYANDWWTTQWVHKEETVVSYAKGEGPSQMVANLVSADHRWLWSPVKVRFTKLRFTRLYRPNSHYQSCVRRMTIISLPMCCDEIGKQKYKGKRTQRKEKERSQ